MLARSRISRHFASRPATSCCPLTKVAANIPSSCASAPDRLQMSKKLALIASKGTLDWAYPPLILASTAAALDYEVQIFFTFYGLELLRKDLKLKVSPLGNPGMPMKMPFGPNWF